MVVPDPLPLRQIALPFDDPDWIYEIKYDGFRALAVIENGHCQFLSRNKHTLYGLTDLAKALANEVQAGQAILDGELAVCDTTGRSIFASMMQDRQQARYFAFDLLFLRGKDLTERPLLERKAILKRLLPARSPHLLYVDHVVGTGVKLFRAALDLDLEGIVAKRADSPYAGEARRSPWIKIKNPDYSQKEGRHELFERKRSV